MFDIDKLILSTLYYERSKNGVKTVGLTDIRKNTANNLLRQYLQLLKDRRYDHLKYRSIDNDTELIKDVLGEIYSSVTTQIEPYQYEVLSNQVNTMQQFATGKIGIGPFALNNNSQILTQLFGVRFAHRDDSILTYFDKDRLDRVVDDNGNAILSWISAFINAHVDIAKDPYITSLNINKATYNIVALLMRTGFGENALYFLNNPIIRELAELELQQNGNIIDNPQISKSRRIRNATRDYIKETFNDSGLNSYFKDKAEGKTKSQVASFPLIKLIFDQGILKDMVVNKAARIDPNGPLTVANMSKEKMYTIDGVKYSPFELQAQLFLAKEAFDKYANALSSLVQFTKIDTKKQGNTVQQQRTYYAKYLNLMESQYFDSESLNRMLHSSFIDTKTKYGTHMLQDILEQVSITATNEFFSKVGTICDYVGNRNDDTRSHVANALIAYIKQMCMNKALEKRGFTSQNWRDMIIGNKTLAQRIEGLKRWLLSDTSGKYSALVSNGMIINPLLDNLRRVPYISQFGTEHYDLVTLDNTSDDSQDNSNNYIDAWQQLLDFTVTDDEGNLTAPCKAIRQLANDLAIYAFMTSADTRGFTKFFKYVPISWRKAIGYSDEMSSAFEAFRKGNVYTTEDGIAPEDGFVIDLDEFFLNFSYDNTIIPVTDKYTTGYNGNRYNRFNGTSKGFDVLSLNGEVVTASEYALLFPTGIDYERSENTGKFPMYIKLQRNGTNRNSPDRYLLYRCIGTFDRGRGLMLPLYGLVTPKGVSIRVGALTYQFYSIGRDDQYKHIYDKPGKRMTQAQYEDWIDRVVNELQQSVKEGYKLEDLAKYPQWAKFIQSKFLNPTGITAEQLISVRSNRGNSIEKLNFLPTTGPLSNYILHSGGAVGADTMWGKIGEEFGIPNDPTRQRHYYNNEKTPNGNIQISQEDYKEGRYKVAQAAKANWGYQYDTMKDDRLIRNWAQVKYADAIFAIGHLVNEGQKLFPNKENDTRVALHVAVQGGTGYAVEMGIQAGKPVYVYDQERLLWYSNIDGKWSKTTIPTLTPNFAGIGTREINQAGVQAIRDVYLRTFERIDFMPMISDKTADFGVQIDSNLKQNYATWQQNNPNGIVAYRVNFNQYNTSEETAAGRIGNPFSETNRNADTVEQFYNWLINGINYNEPKATEAYRQAIINKILSSPEGTPILYYKELNRPSHATVIGYLINHKELLLSRTETINRQSNSIQDMATPEELERARKTKEHCNEKGDKS